jgi:hypothetical protein
MVERRPDEAAWGMATVVAGIPIYYLLRGTSRRSGSPG